MKSLGDARWELFLAVRLWIVFSTSSALLLLCGWIKEDSWDRGSHLYALFEFCLWDVGSLSEPSMVGVKYLTKGT